MSERYFCPACNKPFSDDECKYDGHAGIECPFCSYMGCIDRTQTDIDALRAWLDEWHPASEPPETVKREPCPPNAPPCEGNPAVCPWCREAHNDHA